MTTASWLMVGQTVVFLAVCGFAWWAARLIAEAADNSTRAAEQALQAARDAAGTAADVRQMRDMLRTWLDQQESLHTQQHTPRGPRPTGRVGTDTAETAAVLTPQAIIDRSNDDAPDESSSRGSSRAHRGRHAAATDSPLTAALRAAASRTSRDK